MPQRGSWHLSASWPLPRLRLHFRYEVIRQRIEVLSSLFREFDKIVARRLCPCSAPRIEASRTGIGTRELASRYRQCSFKVVSILLIESVRSVICIFGYLVD